jgi:hypothetical protein
MSSASARGRQRRRSCGRWWPAAVRGPRGSFSHFIIVAVRSFVRERVSATSKLSTSTRSRGGGRRRGSGSPAAHGGAGGAPGGISDARELTIALLGVARAPRSLARDSLGMPSEARDSMFSSLGVTIAAVGPARGAVGAARGAVGTARAAGGVARAALGASMGRCRCDKRRSRCHDGGRRCSERRPRQSERRSRRDERGAR